MITILEQRLRKKIKTLKLRHTFNSSPKNLYYFGYGANIDPDFMSKRGFSSIFIGLACLEDYQLKFNTPCEYAEKGFAGIEKSPGSIVYGSLYKISKESLELLDCLEWVQYNFYARQKALVRHDGTNIEAEVYIPLNPKDSLYAPIGYKNLIINGAKKIKCPDSYITYLEELPSKVAFVLDHGFNLRNPEKSRIFPPRFYALHDRIREKLCNLI